MSSPPAPPGSSYPAQMMPTSPGAPFDPAVQVPAVKMVRLAAVANFAALLVLFLVPVAVIYTTGVGFHLGFIHFGSGVLTATVLGELLTIVVIGAVLTLVSVILYVVAFNAMRKVGPGFVVPMALTIVGLLGLLLIVVGLYSLLQDFHQAVGCAASGAGSGCFNIYETAGAVYMIFGGALLALIGWIGMLIGIFRVGSRYGSTITKVGAILYIIPIASLVAPILVLVGVQGIVHRLESPGRPPG